MTTPAPAPMTAERLAYIRNRARDISARQEDRLWSQSATLELLAHIDFLTSRVAELERERDEWASDVHASPLKQLTERAMKAEAEVARLNALLAKDGEIIERLIITERALDAAEASAQAAETKLETIRLALFPDPEHHITHHARYNLEGALADLEAGQNDPTVRRTLKRVAGQIAAAERVLQTRKDTTP